MVLAPFGTVLVVEDDDALRDGAVEVLLHAGYAAFGARSIRGALGLLKTLPGRCLILLDLALVDGDGREVVEGLSLIERSAARFSVIIASADEHVEETRKMPYVVDVMKKPYSRADLLAVVNEYASGLSRDYASDGRKAS